ncbi:class I SAM-dependent methyltransferase [Nocardioides sp. C4-1]|uniref:class I SAM-dependent methyltransferase n=1 Tax=Nocardioides sp. C4-1 TaxID=3151851 RepID=UPI003267F266
MRRDDVVAIYERHQANASPGAGLGAIAVDEVMWVQGLVERHRPQQFLEIGMASGLSAGVLAHVLGEHGARHLTTVDYDNTFFGDHTKENGYLIESIYPDGPVTIEKLPFTVAADVVALGRDYDMAFIDANHQQPYPLLDTLCIWPALTGAKIVIHHDLRLYKDQAVPFGIGPKYVFDQFPDTARIRSEARGGNIFALDLSEISREQIERIAVDGLLLPWTMRTPMPGWIRKKTRRVLREHYSPQVLEAFDTGLERYNVPYAVGGPARS